jgi:hypothetical protein
MAIFIPGQVLDSGPAPTLAGVARDPVTAYRNVNSINTYFNAF